MAGRDDVDPKRIGVWGGSYGGYLTALWRWPEPASYSPRASTCTESTTGAFAPTARSPPSMPMNCAKSSGPRSNRHPLADVKDLALSRAAGSRR